MSGYAYIIKMYRELQNIGVHFDKSVSLYELTKLHHFYWQEISNNPFY